MPLFLRMLVRERRAGELRLLLLALVIAVASLSSVGFLSDRVQAGLERESHQMLGADLLLVADHPWPADFATTATQHRLRVAQTMSFPSMVVVGEGETARMQLADIKAVSLDYPLRGRLRIQSGAGRPDEETHDVPAPGSVWVDSRLASVLDLTVGGTLFLGGKAFCVAALLTLEPDRAINFFSVAPRLMMNMEDVAATGLVQQGSRVRYRLLVAGEDASQIDEFRIWANGNLKRGERIEDASNARPQVRSVLDVARRFLGLTAFLAVVLAAVGIALAVRRYVQRHLDPFAVMRCLGVTQQKLFRLVLFQFAALGLIGATLGVAVGYLAHWVLHLFLADLIGTPLPSPGGWPVVQGYVVGWVLVFSFALPPVLQIRRVPTLRVIRRELGAMEVSAMGSFAFGGMVLVGLLFWVAGDPKLGFWASVGFIACLGVFAALGYFLIRAVGALARRRGGGNGLVSPVRMGARSLARRPGASALQALALSMGFLALLLLTVTRNDVLHAWQQSVPADAHNRFVINIQPDQVGAVQGFFKAGQLDVILAPMVRGRLSEINGQRVTSDEFTDERAKRLVEREFNLSWRDELPEGNVISDGRGFAGGDVGRAFVTVEDGLAKALALKVGDRVRFNIAESSIEAQIIGLRTLDWDSMRVNFFVLFPSGVIEDQPTSFITSFFLPDGQHHVVNSLVRQFPNLTVIDVSAILRQLQSVIGQVTLAVEFLFMFTFIAGFVVLYAALLAMIDERKHEYAILRALGARRMQLQLALASEFAAIGGIAGLLAGLGAFLVGQVLAIKVFEIVAPLSYWVIPAAVLGGSVLVALAGSRAIRHLLDGSPLEAIRAAG